MTLKSRKAMMARSANAYTGDHLATFWCTCGCEQFQFHVADKGNVSHAGVAYDLADAEAVCLNILAQIRTIQKLRGISTKIVN